MTLREIYSAVKSNLNLTDTSNVSYNDIVNAINDAIREHRIQYIQSISPAPFLTTETLYFTIQDLNYPFTYSTTLTNNVCTDLPIEQAIINAMAYRSNKIITTSAQTFSIGDKAMLGNNLYIAVRPITNEITNTLIFDPKNVKMYYANNGLTYYKGDVLYDSDTQAYWIVQSDFNASTTTQIDQILDGTGNSVVDKAAWKYIGTGLIPAVFYKFTRLLELSLYPTDVKASVFSIVKNKLYVSTNTQKITISYIPEWTPVEDLTDILDLPDTMYPLIKLTATQNLGIKFNIQLQIAQQQQQTKQPNK